MRKKNRNNNEENHQYTQFVVTGHGKYEFAGSPLFIDKLPPGTYTIDVSIGGTITFSKKDVITSKYIELPTMITSSVISDIETFWRKETKDKFDKFGLVYKRGTIMYGVPGTGKTCTIFKIISKIVEMGGIAIYNPDPYYFSEAIKILHSIQGETPIVCVFEEFEKICADASFLSLLDGDLQVPSIYYLATTNYIERVPQSIKNRPSRFAKIVEVDKPDETARFVYIQSFLKDATESDLAMWVGASKGFVLDQIKEMIISVECFGESLESAKEKASSFNFVSKDAEDEEDDGDDNGRSLNFN